MSKTSERKGTLGLIPEEGQRSETLFWKCVPGYVYYLESNGRHGIDWLLEMIFGPNTDG